MNPLDKPPSLLPVETALATILRAIRPLGIEYVPLSEALGRVVRESVVAGRDLPPWDNSAVDGYAVVADDVCRASAREPVTLRVVEEIAAGRMPTEKVAPGAAARIMTGAPMPAGADAVVMVEDTSTQEDRVQVRESVQPGESVRLRGQDVRAGAMVIPEGRRARPAELGMLASLGRASLVVGRKPRVGILATGDELANPGEPERPDRIFDTNSVAIGAQAAEAGAVPVRLGIARDTPEDLRDKLRSLDGLDALIVCGGVSVGRFDFVKEVLAELGMALSFWRVAMKPGSPMAFGQVHDRPVFGLPGNPVSSMVTFEVLVRPALLRLAGATDINRPSVIAELSEAIVKPRGKTHFVRAVVSDDGGRLCATPTGSQDSGVLTSMVRANGFIELPRDAERIAAGQTVRVRLLQGEAGAPLG